MREYFKNIVHFSVKVKIFVLYFIIFVISSDNRTNARAQIRIVTHCSSKSARVQSTEHSREYCTDEFPTNSLYIIANHPIVTVATGLRLSSPIALAAQVRGMVQLPLPAAWLQSLLKQQPPWPRVF